MLRTVIETPTSRMKDIPLKACFYFWPICVISSPFLPLKNNQEDSLNNNKQESSRTEWSLLLPLHPARSSRLVAWEGGFVCFTGGNFSPLYHQPHTLPRSQTWPIWPCPRCVQGSLLWTFQDIVKAFLLAHWQRICLPKQETRVQSLVPEDPTCHGATKPEHHNCWACTLEPCSATREASTMRNPRTATRVAPAHCN